MAVDKNKMPREKGKYISLANFRNYLKYEISNFFFYAGPKSKIVGFVGHIGSLIHICPSSSPFLLLLFLPLLLLFFLLFYFTTLKT